MKQKTPQTLFHRRPSRDEGSEDLINRFRLLAVNAMAGAVDDVHFRYWTAIGDQFKERAAAP